MINEIVDIYYSQRIVSPLLLCMITEIQSSVKIYLSCLSPRSHLELAQVSLYSHSNSCRNSYLVALTQQR